MPYRGVFASLPVSMSVDQHTPVALPMPSRRIEISVRRYLDRIALC